jgi:outer membrane receptor protein involved in Fe transport
MTADIGIRISAPGLGAGTLSMFLVERKNGINLSGEVRTVNGRLMELYENRDQDSKGLELDLRSRRFTNAVQFFFTSTVLAARIAGPAGMRKDREIPRAILAGGLLASRWGCDLNLYWKSVSSYESLRFAEPAVYRPLGGFNNVDAVLARRFGLRKQTRVYAETKNIANRGYSTVVGYPDYGRRMTIGLDYSF